MTERERLRLPIACTLDASHGAAQVAAWRRFDAEYRRASDRDHGSVTVHYAKEDDSIARLTELVSTEQQCCGFAQWIIDTTQDDLRLTVTGPDEALASLVLLAESA